MVSMVDRYNLISMQINNFKAFEKVELDFTNKSREARKILTLFGNQGSGKSTIISAFQWCAYGTSISQIDKLFRQNIYPGVWNVKQKNSISVLVKFRASGGKNDGTEDIHCKRTLLIDKKNDFLEVISGDGTSNQGQEAEDLFRQIFGSKPHTGEGVMWVIRQEEMRRMAATVVAKGNSRDSYYLNFMNLDVPYDGLLELKKAHDKSIEKLLKQDVTLQPGILDEVKLKYDFKAKEYRKIIKEIEKLMIKVNESKLTKDEEIFFDAKTHFDKSQDEFSQAESTLKDQRIRKQELPELLNCLLYSKLSKQGVEIKKSFASSEFDWIRIAEFLEATNWLNRDQIEKISRLDEYEGYSTISLLKSKEKVELWRNRINSLKDAMISFRECKKTMDELEIRGITKESTSKVSQKRDISDQFQQKLRQLISDKHSASEDQITALNEYKRVQTSLTKVSNEQEKLTNKLKRVKIIEGIMQSIKNTNDEYLRDMFELTIKRAKYYWDEIDQVGKYEPSIVHEPYPQIALTSKINNSIRYIDIDSNGDASGGESELLLVCTCLAVSESSGAKMPIILDDCFTKVDKKTREILVETVAKHFGNLIFVTNDEDKAALLKSSEGTLSLNWSKLQKNILSINTDIHDWWAKWS